jgi:DNA polymerase III epsilon subunit-like protein
MDIMLDFETMGNGPTTAVVQIGMIKFVIGTGVITGEFLTNVSLQDEMAKGFSVAASTIEWWMQQDHRSWMGAEIDSVTAFKQANEFMRGATRVWSHATFDAPIYFEHMNKLGIPQSVHYTKFVDLRTLTLMAKGRLSIPKEKRPEGAHDALVDARYQAAYATMCYKAVKGIK